MTVKEQIAEIGKRQDARTFDRVPPKPDHPKPKKRY
jgi:hypothetical protein